jgi:hypothetical protein
MGVSPAGADSFSSRLLQFVFWQFDVAAMIVDAEF